MMMQGFRLPCAGISPRYTREKVRQKKSRSALEGARRSPFAVSVRIAPTLLQRMSVEWLRWCAQEIQFSVSTRHRSYLKQMTRLHVFIDLICLRLESDVRAHIYKFRFRELRRKEKYEERNSREKKEQETEAQDFLAKHDCNNTTD